MTNLTITLNLDNDAFQPDQAEEAYRILSQYAGLIGFLGRIEERALLDINGNIVGSVELGP